MKWALRNVAHDATFMVCATILNKIASYFGIFFAVGLANNRSMVLNSSIFFADCIGKYHRHTQPLRLGKEIGCITAHKTLIVVMILREILKPTVPEAPS